jgi:two-component sensor histidine kinase
MPTCCLLWAKCIYQPTLTVLLFHLILFKPTVSQAQRLFVIDSSTSKTKEIDIVSHLYNVAANGSAVTPVVDVLAALPFNQQQTFTFGIRNAAADSVYYTLRFGSRYVNAFNILIYSGNGTRISFPEFRNAIHLRIGPNETRRVSFSLKELDRVNPKKLSVSLIASEALAVEDRELLAMQSFFLGLFAFLTVFNLIIYLVTRWKVYLKYSLYIFCALLYFLYYYGFIQKAFPSVNSLSINLVSTWYYAVFILYFFFLNEFGEYKKYSPWAHKLLNIGIINKCIQLAYESMLNPLGVEFIYSLWYKNTILVAEIILMVFIIYFILKNKNVRGKIVVLASLMLITGAILGQLDFEASLRGTLVQLGITAELLTFSVGLGYLTKEFYTGRQKAQTELINQLRENQKMQESIQEKLERTVRERTTELEKRNKENEGLLAEIHHRVKNNLQIISSLVNLKTRQSDSIETNEALQQLNGRIFSIGLIHEKLYQNENIRTVRLDEYLGEISHHLLSSFKEKNDSILLHLNGEPIEMDLDRALTCGLIANELITNAIKYAFTHDQKDRKISLSIRQDNGTILLDISDNGRSTKPISGNFNKSFGLRFVDQLVITKLGGEWRVKLDNGVHIIIKFTSTLNGTRKN